MIGNILSYKFNSNLIKSNSCHQLNPKYESCEVWSEVKDYNHVNFNQNSQSITLF